MKIEHVTCIWMFVYAMIFELPEMAKSEILDFSGPTCVNVKVWVRVISSSILYVDVVLKKFQW